MSDGAFWVPTRFRVLRYWGCLPIVGFDLVGVVEGLGGMTGWLP
jgi:hypothetical protein